MKRILCATLLACLLCALASSAFADTGGMQQVTLGIPFTVKLDVGPHGRVKVNGTVYTGIDSFRVMPGTTLKFYISPDSNYKTASLTLTGEDVLAKLSGGVYTLTVNRDEELTVRFAWSPGKTPSAGPRTGDDAAPARWAAMAAFSSAALAAFAAFAIRRRRNTR